MIAFILLVKEGEGGIEIEIDRKRENNKMHGVFPLSSQLLLAISLVGLLFARTSGAAEALGEAAGKAFGKEAKAGVAKAGERAATDVVGNVVSKGEVAGTEELQHVDISSGTETAQSAAENAAEAKKVEAFKNSDHYDKNMKSTPAQQMEGFEAGIQMEKGAQKAMKDAEQAELDKLATRPWYAKAYSNLGGFVSSFAHTAMFILMM